MRIFFYIIPMMRIIDRRLSTERFGFEFTKLWCDRTVIGQQFRQTLDLLCKENLNV